MVSENTTGDRTTTPSPTRRAFARGAAAGLFCLAGGASPVLAATAVGLDAAELGLTPDGGDQSANLQRAIDRAADLNQPLHVPTGDYAVSNIVLPRATHLIGVAGRTRFVAAGAGPLLTSRGADVLHLAGLSFDAPASGPAAEEALVQVDGCDGLLIRDCDFGRSQGNGLALTGCAGTIAGNRFRNAQGAALFARDGGGLMIEGNRVTDCYDNGILIWRSEPGEDGAIVTGNRIARIGARSGGEGQWGNGINLYRAGGIIVAHNRIEDCAFTAVRVNAGPNCQIVGNNCARLGEVAIYAEFAFDGAVIADNIVSQAALGISVTNFNQGGRLATVSGNLVRDLFTRDHWEPRGIGISVEADTVLDGNVVENAPVAGLNLGWGRYLRNVLARGNLVRNAPIGLAVSVAEGVGRAVISGNLFDDTPTGAIIGMDHAEAVTGDLLGAEALPAHLTLSGNIASNG